MIPKEQWERERQSDGTFRVRCSSCGKSVSSPLVEPVIVRAWVQCPECLEATPRDAMLKSSDGTWRYIDVRGDTWRLRMTGDPSLPFTIEIESRT